MAALLGAEEASARTGCQHEERRRREKGTGQRVRAGLEGPGNCGKCAGYTGKSDAVVGRASRPPEAVGENTASRAAFIALLGSWPLPPGSKPGAQCHASVLHVY